MDQCTSVMGREGALLLLDCRSRTVRLTPLADPEVVALIVNSNVKHELTDGGYATRRRQCEEAARMLGVAALRDVNPEQLEAAAQAGSTTSTTAAPVTSSPRSRARSKRPTPSSRGDWPTVGRLMYASHASLRDDYRGQLRGAGLARRVGRRSATASSARA